MCAVCGKGEVKSKDVTLTLEDEGQQVTVIIHGVPANVCDECGERFFDDDVMEASRATFHAAVADAVKEGKALRVVTYGEPDVAQAGRRMVRSRRRVRTP